VDEVQKEKGSGKDPYFNGSARQYTDVHRYYRWKGPRCARIGQIHVLDKIEFEPGAFYVMDKF